MSTTPDPSMPVVAYLYPRHYGRGVGFVRPDDYVDEDDNLVQADNLIRQRDAEAALAALRKEFNAAIDFAIEQGAEARTFLEAWREGDTGEWPEFQAATHLAASKGAAHG